jgi:predicted ATP-dependent protease
MMREDEEEVDFAGLERRVEELSDLEINGRQIRNVLTTARQLAIFKMVTMEWEHVQKAIRAAADFTRYIQTVHGHTDEQNARDEKWR